MRECIAIAAARPLASVSHPRRSPGPAMRNQLVGVFGSNGTVSTAHAAKMVADINAADDSTLCDDTRIAHVEHRQRDPARNPVNISKFGWGVVWNNANADKRSNK